MSKRKRVSEDVHKNSSFKRTRLNVTECDELGIFDCFKLCKQTQYCITNIQLAEFVNNYLKT